MGWKANGDEETEMQKTQRKRSLLMKSNRKGGEPFFRFRDAWSQSLKFREAPSAMHSPVTVVGDWPRGLSLTTDQLRGRSAGRWQPHSRLQGYPVVMASQTPADSAAALPQAWCAPPCERPLGRLEIRRM